MSQAERVKFGSSSASTSASGAAKMPGAQSSGPGDMTQAERVKFGASAAKMPGAQSSGPGDMSQAERGKYRRIQFKFVVHNYIN